MKSNLREKLPHGHRAAASCFLFFHSVLIRQKWRQRGCHVVDVPRLPQDLAAAVEFINKACPGGKAEHAGGDADLIIERTVPGDHIVRSLRSRRVNRLLHPRIQKLPGLILAEVMSGYRKRSL